jgi:hypothetical protein
VEPEKRTKTTRLGLLYDLEADLTRSLLDTSPITVTAAELESAYGRLASLSDTELDSAVYDLSHHSNPGSFADNYIGNLINALADQEPAKLDEFVGRIVTAINPENTGPMLMNKIRGDAWHNLTTAIERMPDVSSRVEVITALGGGPNAWHKLAYDFSLALLDGDGDRATRIADFAARADRMAPGTMPNYIAHIARQPIDPLLKAVSKLQDPRPQVHRGRLSSVEDFQRFAVTDLAMDERAAELLVAGLRVTY